MKSNAADSEELAKTWDERPEVIRDFIEIRPEYEQLCREVAYILTKRMNDSGIEYSAITSRAKTLKSFIEKLSRKNYDVPFKEVTDIAGVRVVFLYKTDRHLIENIIEKEFEVVERVDKIEEQAADKFGYGALHYLVNLGRNSLGARYDDLKGLVCEIQVRTVLQDSWAIIDHHLSYKQETDVPNILKRKLNSLSGLFETADDQFARVRTEREDYKKSIKNSLDSKDGTILKQEVNFDTLTEFLKLKFPTMRLARDDSHLSTIVSRTNAFGYSYLSELDQLLSQTQKARAAIGRERAASYAVFEVGRAIALLHPESLNRGWNPKVRALIIKHRALVSE